MKKAKDFLKALEENKDLARELDKKLAESGCGSDEAALDATVLFAKEKGYEFEAEELSMAKASKRSMSDDELDGITGGNDFCFGDYACPFIYNKCQFLNECELGFTCTEALWCEQNLHGEND